MNTKHHNGLKWFGIALIVLSGLIHLLETHDAFLDMPYKGVLFAASGIGAMLAAFLMLRDETAGWRLGLAVALSTALGYVLSRTVGLPFMPAEPDAWFEPLGVLSLVAEVAFVGVLGLWYTNSSDAELERPRPQIEHI